MIGYTVDVFKSDVKIAHEHFYLKPGMLVELEVVNDGELKYVYDGPMPAQRTEEPESIPDTRRLGPDGRPIGNKTQEAPMPALGSEAHERLVARIAQGIRSDPQAMSLLEQIKSLNKELEHTKAVEGKNADPALVAIQKRLDHLNDEYNSSVQAISEKVRARMHGQQNLPDGETP